MRMTLEELYEKLPWMKDCKQDPIAIWYGDEPSNIDEYGFCNYNTEIGKVIIKDNSVIYGNVNVKYDGKLYTIYLLANSFEIVGIYRTAVRQFVSKEFDFHALHRTYEKISKEAIEKILSDPLKDYGYGIQMLMKKVRNIYATDSKNYLEEKLKEYNDRQPKDIPTSITKTSYNAIYSALDRSLNNYIKYVTDYPEKNSELLNTAELVLKHINDISTKVLEMFIFPIKEFDYPDKVKHWLYDFLYFCIDDGELLSLERQNTRLKNYPHFDASDKKPKTLGDYKEK